MYRFPVVVRVALLCVAIALPAPPLPAIAASAQASVARCQKTAAKEGSKLAKNLHHALSRCLAAVAASAPDASGAAAVCRKEFQRIGTSAPAGSLEAKFAAKVALRCVPGGPGVTHSSADVLGPGASVAEPIDAAGLAQWCASFGGDGAVDNVDEWISCLASARRCTAHVAVATDFPRALEWLALVRTSVQALADSADAVTALDASAALIDGFPVDGVADLACGGRTGPVCGNNVIEDGEICDGGAPDGLTCVALGLSGGTLGCSADCQSLDTSGCIP